ncbi:MAG TPA: hypothetical protein VKV35_10275 [Streptosporangiaceae bacterium]|jgi:hypothetical protein|nr:hypothetical protein [Streptosporangiaceae bacterium]
MMIIRMTAASLPGTSGRPLDIAALISWLLTVGIGVYMLCTWIARGGLRRQRATGAGVPPPVVFGHAGAAVAGLAVWAGYVGSGWRPLAWLGVVLVGTAISLGICTVTLWTPYPVRPETVPGGGGAAGVWGGPPRHEQGGRGGDRLPGDADFAVTDEMIARLLTEPSPARPRATSLVPLIPVAHGFAAITTFMLVVLAAAIAG